MAITVWNVRGLNNPTRQLEVRRMLTSLRAEIFGLLETKIKRVKETEIKEALGEKWSRITNHSITLPDLPNLT